MKVNELKQQAIDLLNLIKRNQREIDNTALVIGNISELPFFIENFEEDEK